MQVSNSTGQNTDYRVGATGGGGGSNVCFSGSSGSTSSTTTITADGSLPPGETELCVGSLPCTVEFVIDGTVVASQDFYKDPGLVALVESDGEYTIEVTPESADGSIAA